MCDLLGEARLADLTFLMQTHAGSTLQCVVDGLHVFALEQAIPLLHQLEESH
jgi:hypothetical protein